MTVRRGRLVVAAALGVGLAGCAYKPLKAPCSREEGPMGQMSYAPASQAPSPALAAIERAAPQCGPMRAVNAQDASGRPE